MKFQESRTHQITGMVVVLFSILMYFQILPLTIRDVRGFGQSALYYPRIFAVVMGLLGIWLFLSGLVSRNEQIMTILDKKQFAVLLVIGITFLYVILIPRFGFLYSTALVTGLYLYIFGKRTWWIIVFFMAGIPLVLHFFFNYLLKIRLPEGYWFY